MKRSFLSFVSILFAAALIGACDFVWASVQSVAPLWRSTCKRIQGVFLAPIAMSADRLGVLDRPAAVRLFAARDFFSRCAKRARPRIETQWRMCASA